MTPEEESSGSPNALQRLKMAAGFPYVTPGGVSLDALARADEIQAGAGRRKSAPVRKWFVRSLDGAAPMLSVLYSGAGRGGRSGYVSIKVLLSILWKTSAPPFETVMTAPALAELLDLPDPNVKGARRVRDALRTLADANLIRLLPRPGTSPLIQLMNETGNGDEYSLPSTSYMQSQLKKPNQESVTDPNLYFQLPAELWTEGFFQVLKGPGLVMLLIMLSEQANKREIWFSGSEFSERYQISASTRTKGTQELVNLGILNRESVPLPVNWGGATFEQKRRRYQYRLIGVIDRLSDGDPMAAKLFPAQPKIVAQQGASETPASKKPAKRKRRRKKRSL